MRLLRITEENIEAAQHLVRFAADEENWFHAFKDKWIPGDRPEYVLHIDTFKCVFTYTVAPTGPMYRHLSVSVPGKVYPNPIAIKMIADMFGFTGSRPPQSQDDPGFGMDWVVDLDEGEGCVVVVQEIERPS